MSKIIFVSCLLVLVSSLTTPISAEEGRAKALRQEVKDKKVEIKNEIKEKRVEIKETRQETRTTKAQATIKRLRQGLVNRYENTLKHKAAIEARIAKIEAMVVPTGKSKRDLTAAKAKLATFNTSKYAADLAAFDAKQAEVLASSTPLKLTSELKTLTKTVDSDIKVLRQTLADTLRLIIKAR